MILDRKALQSLIEVSSEPCASIFVPTVRAGDVRKNPIRFKNSLSAAEKQLEEAGVDKRVREEILAPGRELVDDPFYWRHQGDGLAAFMAPDWSQFYRLPFRVEELALVGERPYTKPLFSFLSGEGRYYLLALSRNEVRLFEGSADGLRRIDLPDLPSSLTDELGKQTEPAVQQAHAGTSIPSTVAARSASGGERHVSKQGLFFHGHGGGEDDRLEELRQFLHRVSEPLETLLAEADAPLVIAAVERVAAEFHKICRYRNIVEGSIIGNPDEATPEQLHAAAWEKVEPLLDAERRTELERVEELRGGNRVVTSIQDLIAPAIQGRVETLFLDSDTQVWGTHATDGTRVEIHDERQEGDRDLLEVAALHTLRYGGQVYSQREADREADRQALAILRF